MTEKTATFEFFFLCEKHGGTDTSGIMKKCSVCGEMTNKGKFITDKEQNEMIDAIVEHFTKHELMTQEIRLLLYQNKYDDHDVLEFALHILSLYILKEGSEEAMIGKLKDTIDIVSLYTYLYKEHEKAGIIKKTDMQKFIKDHMIDNTEGMYS